MATLTVIIPFYNETAYLRCALNSVLGQRIDGLQIIVVNDNPDMFSPDDLAALGVTDPVELVQHPTNLGLSAARNSGLERARGRYVGFLDSDDYYILGGLAGQLELAFDTKADMVHAPTWFTRKGNPDAHVLPRDKAYFLERKTAKGLLRAEQAQFITSSWSSLYSRDFLFENNLSFDPEQTRFEDRLFVLQSVTRARTIAFGGTPTRVWRGREGSISDTAADPATHLLQIQLLEKCQAHMRAMVAQGLLPARFEKRELFNTVSRLIWDLDVIAAIAANDDLIYQQLGERIPVLLGTDSFGQTIFDDKILQPINRVGMKTRKGRITRVVFFAIHRALRNGDFATAHDLLTGVTAARPAPKSRKPAKVKRPVGKRLVLHLGLHKTGTTYLQHHLQYHRARLRQAGVLIPETGFGNPDQPLRSGAKPGHHGLVAALRAGNPEPWQKLAREIRRNPTDTVLISCENMGFPTLPDRLDWIESLARQLGGFEHTDLIALARRPDAHVESFYRERVALGARSGATGIAAFLVDHGPALCDFPALFEPFERCFGSQVRLADFDAMQGDALWPGFCRLAGLPTDLPVVEVARYETPDRDAIQLLQLLNTLVADPALRHRMLQAWFTLHPRPGSDSSLLSPQQRLQLLDTWQEISAPYAAARGYAPDLNHRRAALGQEQWAAPDTLPMAKLNDLMDIALHATDSLFSDATPRPAPRKRASPDTLLTIRLRPWAANLLHRARRAIN